MKKLTNRKLLSPSALQELNAHLRRKQQMMLIWFAGAAIIMLSLLFVWL